MRIHANPHPQHLLVSSPEVSHFVVSSLPVGVDRELGVGVVDARIRLIFIIVIREVRQLPAFTGGLVRFSPGTT